MDNIPTWLVELKISGPIAITRTINLHEPKGFELKNPFYSDIEILNHRNFIGISVTAYATSIDFARKAALLFVGQMVDVLTFRFNLPFILSEKEGFIRHEYITKRILHDEDFQEAFKESRLLAFSNPDFLRALGWYRKAMVTEDPFDKFLSFWNSIEIVAGKYHTSNDRTKLGIKNQIWQCFESLWDGCQEWPVEETWIDKANETRKNIVHGTAAINVVEIEKIIKELDEINRIAHFFLDEWRQKKLNPEIPQELKHMFGY